MALVRDDIYSIDDWEVDENCYKIEYHSTGYFAVYTDETIIEIDKAEVSDVQYG